MVMKYLLILFGLCLMACNRQSVKQEEKTNSNITLNERLEESIEIPDGSLTKGEQDSLITALSPYLEVDTAYAKNSNKNSQIISKILDDTEEFNNNYIWQNIAHVDSIIKQCINYVQSNKPKLLLDLFNKEKGNIYAHPSNTIEHEKDIHYMILSLYHKYYSPSNERLFLEKMAELYDFTFLHIITLELLGGYFHPDFIPFADVLVDCYDKLNDYDRAIELQKQICERIEQEEPEGKASENYGYELIELATLYLANKDTIHTDSCTQELRKNPYMEKLLKEH